MGRGIRVGRLFGINIYIDWSWLFIFLLVTWHLSAVFFPSFHPDWSLGLNILMGALASLLFFASVLAHELAHSLVAKARGLPVRNITLFIFGGVSNIEREPPSPLTEFLVAVVGPLTSLILGLTFIFAARFTITDAGLLNNPMAAIGQLDPLSTLLIYLGPINLILAVFNLIPGFPLDGGRVLRSILWGITGSLRRATRWATWVGQLVAWTFIIAGIAMVFGFQVPFLGSGLIGGLWLAFIGWFLNNAASQSYQQVVIQDVLEGVSVQRIMREDVPTVTSGMSISQLVDEYVMGTDERAFPVMEGDELWGMVCLEDIRRVSRSDWDSTRVDQIMTPVSELDTVNPREDVNDALARLSRRDVRQMPVVQEGRLVGMLRRRDILRWLQVHSELSTR
jgi:Zn-dependent protease/CBS domain-containing protein